MTIKMSDTGLRDTAEVTMRRPAKDWTLSDADFLLNSAAEAARELLAGLLTAKVLREASAASRNAKVKTRSKHRMRVTVELL